MEQPDSCERHHHIVFIAGFDNVIITDGTAWLCHIFYTALMGSLDVVAGVLDVVVP